MPQNYRFELIHREQCERFQLPRSALKKEPCPACGRKARWRRYVDTRTGQLAPPEYGVCDRVNSCGHRAYPVPDPAELPTTTPPMPKKKTPPMPPRYVPGAVAEATLKKYDENPLAWWLYDIAPPELVMPLLLMYMVGTGKPGPNLPYSTLFWQHDGCGYRCCKRIFYDPGGSGKRIRDTLPMPLHTAEEGYRQCFFGQHLVSPGDTVAVVESEKTALIAKLYYPDFAWVATGGSNGLGLEAFQPFRRNKIILFPDCDKAGRDGFFARYQHLDIEGYTVEFTDVDNSLWDSQDLADILPCTAAIRWEPASNTIPSPPVNNGYPPEWDAPFAKGGAL